MKRLSLAGAVLLLAALPVFAQILPKDAKEPVEVVKPRGEFAKKLNGVVMPTGKGWKGVMDARRRVQIMIPDGWKVMEPLDGENILRVAPPGHDKDLRSALMVNLSKPADADPLDIEEFFALNLADALAEDKQMKRVNFKPTDAALVRIRGMKFALAGGTMEPKKGQRSILEQLVYLAEDRHVVLLFSAPEDEFPKFEKDVLQIFASYQNIGVIKLDVE